MSRCGGDGPSAPICWPCRLSRSPPMHVICTSCGPLDTTDVLELFKHKLYTFEEAQVTKISQMADYVRTFFKVWFRLFSDTTTGSMYSQLASMSAPRTNMRSHLLSLYIHRTHRIECGNTYTTATATQSCNKSHQQVMAQNPTP